MKKILLRTFTLLISIGLGLSISLLMVFAGDKSKGPLEDFAASVNAGLASFEKKIISGNSMQSRSTSLKWFDRYRSNKVLMNAPDTFFIGAYDENTAESYESIVSLEDSLKVKLPVIQIFTAWGSRKDQSFPLLRVQTIHDLGSIPLITWEPWLNDFDPERFTVIANAKNKNTNGLKAIANGHFDEYIDKWADDAKNFGAFFFLRFGHEMNDPYRYPWGPQNNKPEDYVAAWKHIVKRFKSAGANNVIWLWSPHPAYADYADFYPGDDYVDWIGVTVLNYGTAASWSQWWSFDDIFNKPYSDLSQYGKPMMITEFGSLDVGGDRPLWFKEALSSMPAKYPAVKAVLFFHSSNDNTATYKTLDWSFKNDEKVLAVIRQSFDEWKKVNH